MKLQPTEYMYGSARVRAMENNIVGRERLGVLVDAKTTDEAMAKLAEYGIAPDKQDAMSVSGEERSKAREDMLLSVLKSAYDTVSSVCPDPSVFTWLRYPYDCNNIKAAIKCFIRNIDPSDMLFDFGSVPADKVKECVSTGDYTVLPKNMAAAAIEAREEFAKTKDPRCIDTVLDKACYADMLENAAMSDDLFVDWVKAKIDLTNIMITLRIIRMRSGVVGRMMLESVCLDGGSFDKDFFLGIYDGGEDALWDALFVTEYASLATAASESDGSLATLERSADDLWMQKIKDAKWMPFGAPVLAAFLVGHEYEVKNIRMILAAKDAGLSSEIIRGRLRESYV